VIMNNPTKHSCAVPLFGGWGLGGLSWDGYEDPSRRAANYVPPPIQTVERQGNNQKSRSERL